MSHRLLVVAASLFAIMFALGGTSIALAATITDLTITGATYNPRTDVATVIAAVSCSEPIQLRVRSVIFQGKPERPATYAGGLDDITCSPTPTKLSIDNTELLDSARLHPGHVQINVFVESITSPGTTFRGEDAELRMRVAHP